MKLMCSCETFGICLNNLSWCTTVWLENLQPPPPFSNEVPTNVNSSHKWDIRFSSSFVFFLVLLMKSFGIGLLYRQELKRFPSPFHLKLIGYLHKIMNCILFFSDSSIKLAIPQDGKSWLTALIINLKTN